MCEIKQPLCHKYHTFQIPYMPYSLPFTLPTVTGERVIIQLSTPSPLQIHHSKTEPKSRHVRLGAL